MRAVAIKNGTGPAEALYIADDVAKPTPHGHEALVQIKAFGLNRMDLLQREGHYSVPPQASKILGVEFAGVIAQALPNDEGFKEGDHVFGLAYGGAYAEYIAVSTRMLIHKPPQLSFEQAAGIPETWFTASQALYLVADLQPGQSILWHAGASSVSIAGIQLSKSAGASAIYATASSQEKLDFCTQTLGATQGFNYKTQDWSKEILNATGGKGATVIIDFVGQSYFRGNLNAAARDGRIVCLGFMSGTRLPAGVDIGALVGKRLRIEGSSLRSRDEQYQGHLRDTFVEHALPRLCDGQYKLFIEKVLPWEQIVQAHQLMESNQTKGKIVCTIS